MWEKKGVEGERCGCKRVRGRWEKGMWENVGRVWAEGDKWDEENS